MNGRWHGGKGSIPRKRNNQKWSNGYDLIWGEKKGNTKEKSKGSKDSKDKQQ